MGMKKAKKKEAEGISQEELKEFYERKARVDEDRKVMEKVRQSFIDRKGLGAKVENGPFVLEIEPVITNRVNQKALMESVARELGETKFAKIKEANTGTTESNRVSVKKLI